MDNPIKLIKSNAETTLEQNRLEDIALSFANVVDGLSCEQWLLL